MDFNFKISKSGTHWVPDLCCLGGHIFQRKVILPGDFS